MRRLGLISLVFALVATACSTGSDDARLTVYSGRSEELIAPLIERFEEESGIDVAVRYGGSAEIAATSAPDTQEGGAPVRPASEIRRCRVLFTIGHPCDGTTPPPTDRRVPARFPR